MYRGSFFELSLSCLLSLSLCLSLTISISISVFSVFRRSVILPLTLCIHKRFRTTYSFTVYKYRVQTIVMYMCMYMNEYAYIDEYVQKYVHIHRCEFVYMTTFISTSRGCIGLCVCVCESEFMCQVSVALNAQIGVFLHKRSSQSLFHFYTTKLQ